ncbi:MAG: hypothetical protein KKA73_16450 [Chloroflexi bacterium]|nr:hypothetical protein [Chloroflexota bacterium]MBU1749277.1 hypothetical protein [Chloroflexota bacterium]
MHTRTLAIPLALIVALTLAVPTLAFQSQGVWQQVNTPSTPGNLMGHSLVVIDNDVYLFGGVAPSTEHAGDAPAQTLSNALYKYDHNIQKWIEQTPGLAPPARGNHAASVVDGKMVIHGGTDGATVLNDLWVYDPATKTWTEKTPSGPKPPALQYHKAVVSNGQMYLVGGTTSAGTPSDQLWAYDTTASSWTQKTSYPGPYGGTYGASVFTPGSDIMVGGATGDTYYVYNPGTNSWEAKTATNFPNRESPGTAQVGSTGYIFGGRDTATGEYGVESWKADLSGGTTIWEPLPPVMPNIQPDVVLIPEAHSPTSPIWMCAFPDAAQEVEPAVLLYGRSWTYAAGSHNPILGDAATWLFWPGGYAAGPLDGIVVWPEDAVVEVNHSHVFNAAGRDANGYYVPITPTWGATGGAIDNLGRYTAGDWPGTYYVAAEAPPAKSPIMLRDQVAVTVTGTETCPDLPPTSSWSHTFAVTGTYSYHDRANPDHTGSVVVNPALKRPSATYEVSITNTGFDPVQVVIAPNDTVNWTNDDTVTHAVVGGEYKQYYYVYLPLVLKN